MADEYVNFFGQRMARDYAESLAATQEFVAYVVKGVAYPRVPYGSETFRLSVDAATTPCRHCCTIEGKLHEPLCDYEQCPKCGRQRMSCDCEFDGDVDGED